MTHGIVIFCERTGAWAASLARHLEASLPQRHTRSLAECDEALTEHPASLVVLEITSANAERALAWLAELRDAFPRARAVLVAQRGLESFQWAARELGSEAFTTSPRELAPIAELIERHITSLPPPDRTFEEQVWASLPWKEAATHA